MKKRTQLKAIIVIAAVAALWIFWAIALLWPRISLISFFPKEHAKSFQVFGPFGDAFGPISSLMTTIAASAALYAFLNDRYDRSLQNFESNFFALLTNLESVTSQSTVTLSKKNESINFKSNYKALNRWAKREVTNEFTGRTAIKITVYRIREKIGIDGYNNIKIVWRSYQAVFNANVNMLGHWYRTIHHLYRLIDERCPGDKDYYARIVRAQFSNEELCILAYNCIVGEGRLKFRKLAERYSLFHNIHRYVSDMHAVAELSFFTRKLPHHAFRFEDIPSITFDD